MNNVISKLAKIAKNVKIGNNNIIHDNVTIMDDVVIGDNNEFYNDCLICPNAQIGNNNAFLNGNIIGDFPVHAKHPFTKRTFGGIIIGNNNFFHTQNVISSGYYDKTIIGNYNKFLTQCHIGHDNVIENDVHLYPRSVSGGSCVFQSNSGLAACAGIRQNTIAGEYTFVAAGNLMMKPCFPLMLYVKYKPYRMNTHRVPEQYHIYNSAMLELANLYHAKKTITEADISDFPIEMQHVINRFLNHKNSQIQ